MSVVRKRCKTVASPGYCDSSVRRRSRDLFKLSSGLARLSTSLAPSSNVAQAPLDVEIPLFTHVRFDVLSRAHLQ